MKPEEIKLSDWSRIIFGEVPPAFYLELVIRAILVYLLLMLSMRLLGKRISTQMSRLELAAMVALASAIGDRGIVPAYIIAFVIIVINRLNLHHLGSIKRVYMEANGAFTIIKDDEQKPDLLILPDWDKDFITRKLKKLILLYVKIAGLKNLKTLLP